MAIVSREFNIQIGLTFTFGRSHDRMVASSADILRSISIKFVWISILWLIPCTIICFFFYWKLTCLRVQRYEISLERFRTGLNCYIWLRFFFIFLFASLFVFDSYLLSIFNTLIMLNAMRKKNSGAVLRYVDKQKKFDLSFEQSVVH